MKYDQYDGETEFFIYFHFNFKLMINSVIGKKLSMFRVSWCVNLLFQPQIFTNYSSLISDTNLGPNLKCTLTGKFRPISQIQFDKENVKY